MKNLPKINPSKALKARLPYLIAGLLCTKLGEAYRLTTGGDVIDRLLAAFTKLGLVFQNPFPSLHPFDLLVGAAAAVLLRLVVWSKIKNAKKYRHGEEYGTARWGNEKDIAPFINSDFSQNILLTDTERLTLGKIADPEKRNVNLNVLVIGGSGSGKTRYHIKPNLLQMNASYVCSDPKGTVVEEVGRALVQQGHYKLKILNTIDFGCSMHYNPFHYLHSETDILSLVTVIMENTQSKEGKGGDDFWSKAEALLYQALIAYIYYEAPEEEKNMTTLLDMLNACECREDDENFKSAVPIYFLTRKSLGNDIALVLLITTALPFFFFALYEKNGQPPEKMLKNYIRVRFLTQQARPYRTDNRFAALERQVYFDEEVKQFVSTTEKTGNKTGRGLGRRVDHPSGHAVKCRTEKAARKGNPTGKTRR